MEKSTIVEQFILPSRGKIYDKEVNPIVSLSGLKVWQDLKRTSPTEMPYKLMSDIIEECMQEKPAVSVYDMCLGDYNYLLNRLRVITYGSQYKIMVMCPYCGKVEERIVNLEDLEIFEYPDNYEEFKHITLPVSGDEIDLNYQTPRNLDEITRRAKAMQTKAKNNIDYTLLYTLVTGINKVNGETKAIMQLENYCNNLDMKDANAILRALGALSDKVGISGDMILECTNPKCKKEFISPFRITNEFFGPTI